MAATPQPHSGQGSEFLADGLFRQGTGDPFHELAIAEQQKRGYALYGVAGSGSRVLVHMQFADFHPPGKFRGQPVQQRAY
jgi:hypothetical protein